MGAPLGNQNNVKNKIWTDAIRKAVLEREKGKPQRLKRLAHALLDKAEAGDVTALKEMGDRLEGKAIQAIQGTGDNGEIEVKVTMNYVSADRGKPRTA